MVTHESWQAVFINWKGVNNDTDFDKLVSEFEIYLLSQLIKCYIIQQI